MKASVCPKSHKFSKCMELSTDDSLCNIVEISRDEKAKLGRPGRYSSASQAIEEQSKNIAPRSIIVGSSISSSSILVRLLPAQSSLSIVATIKIIEFLLLIYLGTKVPLTMAWRIVIMFYFLALLHFHLKQATSSKKRDLKVMQCLNILESENWKELKWFHKIPYWYFTMVVKIPSFKYH